MALKAVPDTIIVFFNFLFNEFIKILLSMGRPCRYLLSEPWLLFYRSCFALQALADTVKKVT